MGPSGTDAYVNRVFDITIIGDDRARRRRPPGRDRGGRNATLYVAAATVGQLVARGLITEYAAIDRLMAAAAGHIAANAYTPYEAEPPSSPASAAPPPASAA